MDMAKGRVGGKEQISELLRQEGKKRKPSRIGGKISLLRERCRKHGAR